MSMRKQSWLSPLPRSHSRCARRGDRRRHARARQAGHRGRSRALGHQHRARRRRTAAGQRHARAGRRRLRAEMRGLPRQGRLRRPQRRLLSAPGRTERTMANYVPHATTIFDFTRRAMPWPQPKTLTGDETYALTAYILSLNKIIGENDVMNARDAAEGANAEPGRLREQIPGEEVARRLLSNAAGRTPGGGFIPRCGGRHEGLRGFCFGWRPSP